METIRLLITEEDLLEIVTNSTLKLLREFFAEHLKDVLRNVEHQAKRLAEHWCLCKNILNKINYGVQISWEICDDPSYQYQFSNNEINNHNHWPDEVYAFFDNAKPKKTKDGKIEHVDAIYNLIIYKLRLNDPNVVYQLIEEKLLKEGYQDIDVIMKLATEFAEYANNKYGEMPGESLATDLGDSRITPEQCSYGIFKQIPGAEDYKKKLKYKEST